MIIIVFCETIRLKKTVVHTKLNSQRIIFLSSAMRHHGITSPERDVGSTRATESLPNPGKGRVQNIKESLNHKLKDCAHYNTQASLVAQP